MAILRDSGNYDNLVPSAARTTSGNIVSRPGAGSADSIRVQSNVTAITGTGAALDVVIEDSVDAGATWNVIGTFAQRTAIGREVINITIPFTDTIRARWTIAGTTPSVTFAVDWYLQ